jgi:endonuclease/exonuclease/phosphatase family metal-dependent hydrolase
MPAASTPTSWRCRRWTGRRPPPAILDPRDYNFFFPDERDIQRTGFAVRRTLRAIRNADLEGLDPIPNERFSLRRGTDITVEVEGRMLRLLSVHLKAGCREAADRGRECDTLMGQSTVLAGWIAQRRREGAAFAILGDFNRRFASPDDAVLRELTRRRPAHPRQRGRLQPLLVRCAGRAALHRAYPARWPARDWMVQNSLRVMVYAERDPALRDRISDHCPISTRLRID